MAKLNCPCGWQISNVCSPSEWIFHVVSDQEYEKLFDDESDVKNGNLKTMDLWKCSKCGRIALGDNPVTWYLPER